jgi:predicted site-specific integrase-resolvase
MQKASFNTKTVEPAQPLDSPATFARFIGVSAQCVRNWCHDGIIPLKIHVGRIIRFEREAAIQALNVNKEGAN